MRNVDVAANRDLVRGLREVPCHDCGQTYPHYVMEFDHRDPDDKVTTIARMVNRCSRTEILAEISKCDVVCANCHAAKTYLQRGRRDAAIRAAMRRPEVQAKLSAAQHGPCSIARMARSSEATRAGQHVGTW